MCGYIRHAGYKLVILVYRPEFKRFCTLSHVPGSAAWIEWQIVVIYRIGEYCGKHVVDTVQIRIRVSGADLFILPCPDVCRRDLVHTLILEVWEYSILEYVFLAIYAILPQSVADILNIDVVEALEGHVRGALLPFQKLPFPFLGIPL